MERKEIQEKIVKIIKDNMPSFQGVDITETTRINTEANFDSMTFVYIMCKIEAAFDVRVPKRKWERMKTLADIVDAIEKELNNK